MAASGFNDLCKLIKGIASQDFIVTSVHDRALVKKSQDSTAMSKQIDLSFARCQ
jgi:hypothetical protein